MHILLLSNGHGEDLSGALLGAQLAALGATVEAMPLVGNGAPYRQRGIPIAGRTLEISTGGLGYTNPGGQLREIWEGQLSHLIRQGLLLRRRRRTFDRVVAIGDVLPVLAAWLSGRTAMAYLVAYSSHYEGKLRLPWPCGWLLRRPRFQAIWSRDALTADDLSAQLKRRVQFLGNPFFDPVATAAAGPRSNAQQQEQQQTVVLLPGSRLPEAKRNLTLMLALLERLTDGDPPNRPALQLRAALVPGLTRDMVQALASACGWQLLEAGAKAQLVRGHWAVELCWGQFSTVLNSAELVVSMAGTASEQAVGLGLPVVQLVGAGPQFTAGFAEAQRRLLGPGVLCAAGAAGTPATLQATAALINDLLLQLRHPEQRAVLNRQLNALAHERIGPAGGSLRLAQAILNASPQHC